jgi:hypothetical protein
MSLQDMSMEDMRCVGTISWRQDKLRKGRVEGKQDQQNHAGAIRGKRTQFQVANKLADALSWLITFISRTASAGKSWRQDKLRKGRVEGKQDQQNHAGSEPPGINVLQHHLYYSLDVNCNKGEKDTVSGC